MLKIAITVPDASLPDEARHIARLLLSGAYDVVHLRKPGWELEAYEALLRQVPAELHPRLVLHDHHELALRYAVRGIHLNGRHPLPPAGYRGHVSRSCHSVEEVLRYKDSCAYVFLSPVFDSISKAGYGAAFDAATLARLGREGVFQPNVIALGGVTPDRLPQLAAWGFAGAAMLGAAWR